MTAVVPVAGHGGTLVGIGILPVLVAAASARASIRFLEFFASIIRNPHTCQAYARAVSDFLVWCQERGVASIAAVQPLHVAAWIEGQTHAATTVKQVAQN